MIASANTSTPPSAAVYARAKAAVATLRNTRIVRLALAKVGLPLCRPDWRRHDWTLVQLPDRLFVRCESCGAESPGIVLDAPRPRITAR